MTKLHELIAVEPDLKSQATSQIADALNVFSNGTGKLVGQVRRYSPLEEYGEQFSDEVTELATTVGDELGRVQDAFGRWIDVAVQKEQTNGATTADVVVDGQVVLKGLSAPALLNLEGKLTSLRQLYSQIPTNDLAERWEYDEQTGVYVSNPRDTYRTQKVIKSLVLHPPTPEHPAQVQAYNEDIRVGTWTTQKRSGMMSPTDKRMILSRLDVLIRAVKSARQRANEVEANTAKVAQVIFDFIHRG